MNNFSLSSTAKIALGFNNSEAKNNTKTDGKLRDESNDGTFM
jgi:hypothetical protein